MEHTSLFQNIPLTLGAIAFIIGLLALLWKTWWGPAVKRYAELDKLANSNKMEIERLKTKAEQADKLVSIVAAQSNDIKHLQQQNSDLKAELKSLADRSDKKFTEVQTEMRADLRKIENDIATMNKMLTEIHTLYRTRECGPAPQNK